MRPRLLSLLLLSALFMIGCGIVFFPGTSGIITSPSKQGQVLENSGAIFIEFPFSVNRYSVEKIFAIEGSGGRLPGSKLWSGNRLTFTPEPELTYGGRYIFLCQGEARDAKDNPYTLDFEILFFYGSDRELPPQVLSVSPANGQKVPGDTPIRIRFSKSMDKLTFKDGFSLNPDTECRMSWNTEDMEITITPEPEWDNLELYRISLKEAIKDIHGISLACEVEAAFFVETDADSPAVTAAYPAVNDWATLFPPTGETLDGIAYTDAIRLSFSESMAEDTVEEAFLLTPQVTGELVWVDSSSDTGRRDLVFIPETGYEMAASYTLSIGKTAEDRHGNPLLRDAVYRFTTHRNIPVLDISSIQAIKDASVAMTPPYVTASPVDLEGGGGLTDYSYEFVFTFSAGFASDQEKYLAQKNIDIAAVFGIQTSPRAIGYTWVFPNVLSITFKGFDSMPGVEHYYLLEIKGGPGGVKNNGGSHLAEDVRQLLRIRE